MRAMLTFEILLRLMALHAVDDGLLLAEAIL